SLFFIAALTSVPYTLSLHDALPIYGVELLFDFGKGDAAADFGLLTNFDAQLAHQLDFAQGIGGTGLVGGNPVSVEPAGNFVAIEDRKSTRLNSSHGSISYAVFCLKK